jgi:hypothetical protein
MSKSVGQIEREIAALQLELVAAKAEEDRLKALTVEQRVAIIMHSNQCKLNHMDGCGWEYEVTRGVHDFKGGAHKHWLEKSTATVKRLQHTLGLSQDDQIVTIIEAVIARK